MVVIQPAAPQPRTLAHLDAELTAMQAVYDAICKIDAPAQERVLNWLTSRLGAEWTFGRDVAKEPPF